MAWLLATVAVSGCGLLNKKSDADDMPPADGTTVLTPEQAERNAKDGEDGQTERRNAFTLTVDAPATVREFLERNMELQRYRQLDDLQAAELSRLLGAADVNVRELLNTRGYFTPRIEVTLRETPEDPRAPREIVVAVQPNALTRIADVDIGFAGAIANDLRAAAQRDAVIGDWSLPPDATFTQGDWDGAKSAGLRLLTAHRYPTARVGTSRAEVDADAATAKLGVTYDSGPAYRFGPLRVRGNERYDPEVAVRLARLPTGADYDQAKLLEAQQRLASSGYYDSVFLTLDTESGNPDTAPVVAQVRDASLQKVVFGVGFSTDSGPRVSADHTHNQLPYIGWRALSKALFDAKTQSISSELTSLPDDNQWRWVTSGLLQREEVGTYDVNSGRLRGGRGKSSDHIDRNYYLQYDYATNQGQNAPPSASSVSLNYSWTGRYFNDANAPTRGYGLAFEAGPGYTLTGERSPFVRLYSRWLGFRPLGAPGSDSRTEARRSRLALRAELGTVIARDTAQLPATQLFLTGGDTTVRGYSYRQIGARTVNDEVFAGRHMAVASVELQRPVVWNGQPTDFESTTFVDVGAVADEVRDLSAKVGVGAGVRWRSPVGPVQADLAYGVDTKKLRLHLRLGFTF